MHAYAGGQRIAQILQGPVQSIGKLQGVRAGLLADGEHDRRAGAQGCITDPVAMADVHGGHIGHAHRPTHTALYHHLAQFIDVARSRRSAHDVLLAVLGDLATRGVLVAAFTRLLQFFKCYSRSLHAVGIGNDLILFVQAAHHDHIGHARHALKARTQVPFGERA